MNKEEKNMRNLGLILPAGLLILIVVIVVVLLAMGYDLPEFLVFFFIVLGLFLIYQTARQLMARFRIQRALNLIKGAQSKAEAGEPMAALKIYKDLLLQLPRDEFMKTLNRMKDLYQNQGMDKAVEQVDAIRAESEAFFEKTSMAKRITLKDRREWQAKAIELRNMIQALPVEEDQDLADVHSEE